MPNAVIKRDEITGGHAPSGRPSGRETLEELPELESRRQLHVFQDSTPGVRTAVQPEIARRSAAPNLASDHQTLEHRLVPHTPDLIDS